MKKLFGKIRTELKILKRISQDYGHYNSVKKRTSVDKNNNPIPWYTYPAIEYLNQFDYKNKKIFEWGSGYSSLFWSKIAKEVISIEDNQDWFNIIKNKRNKNMKLFLIEDKNNYINIISSFNKKFDVIIIDGKYRQECINNAVKQLKSGGIIIFDNSDRYPKTCKKLKDKNNLIQIDFNGFAPIVDFTFTTSIFLSRDFNFRAKNNQPIHSIGSIKELCE